MYYDMLDNGTLWEGEFWRLADMSSRCSEFLLAQTNLLSYFLRSLPPYEVIPARSDESVPILIQMVSNGSADVQPDFFGMTHQRNKVGDS